MSTLFIRRAIRTDVKRILQLSQAGGPEGSPRMALPETLPEGYWSAFERIDQDPRQALMVAEMGGEVIGTFHITWLTYLAGEGRDDCQVESVHVDSRWRGKGIGTQMMAWVLEEARKRQCRRIQLTSDKRRKDAHRFYERLGFVLSHEGAKLIL